MMRRSLFLFVLLNGILAEARVFNLNSEHFAAYIRGTMGSKIKNTLNESSHGTDVTLDSYHAYNFSGEFGFVYTSPHVNFRFGLEVVRPPDNQNAVGRSATTESDYYTMTSEVSVMVPKLVLEIPLVRRNTWQITLNAGGGYASLAARNSYSMTAAGTTNLGVSEFVEDLRGSAVMYEGSLAFEKLFSDTTTFVFEGGFRSMAFKNIKHNLSATTFQGAVVKGDAATNMDGSQREINMSSGYGGLALRFWIN